MFKKNFVLIATLIVFTACADKNTQLNTKNKAFDNSNHIIGNKENSITTITYNEIYSDGNNVKITFYIDKFPYYKKFNLCQNNTSYKNIKSVTTNKKGEDFITYQENPLDCNSYIHLIQSEYNQIEGDYKFNYIQDFSSYKIQGYDSSIANPVSRKSQITIKGGVSKNEIYSESDFIKNKYTNIFWTKE